MHTYTHIHIHAFNIHLPIQININTHMYTQKCILINNTYTYVRTYTLTHLRQPHIYIWPHELQPRRRILFCASP